MTNLSLTQPSSSSLVALSHIPPIVKQLPGSTSQGYTSSAMSKPTILFIFTSADKALDGKVRCPLRHWLSPFVMWSSS